MTYSCTLKSNGNTNVVDFNNTWAEGSGPRIDITNEIAVLDTPLDSNGDSLDMQMDFKYCPVRLMIEGQFKDGIGSMNWNSPTTKAEKLVALQKLEIIPLVLTWPVTTKTWCCCIEHLTLGEQGGFGNTITYDLTLRITGCV